MTVLELRDLSVRFGGLKAVDGVSLRVEEGKVFSIIGPNGAGKTTVFNAVTGVCEPTGGEVLILGADARRPLTGGVAGRLAAVGLLTGLLAMLAMNLEPLWDATITANFRFRQPFPWLTAAGSFFGYLAANPGACLGAFLLGGAIGGAGAWVVWSRARRNPAVIAASGVCRTFQNIRLFPEMTALENVITGMDMHLRTRLWDMVLRTPRFRREDAEARARGRELLEFVGLGKLATQLARNMAYGDQRRLEIARALATRPRILLLDEPAAGMNPAESAALVGLIARIRDTGVTVVLIEHHMKVVMGISDHVVVLNHGARIAEGTPDEVRADPEVIEAYLGKEEVA